MTLLTIIWIVLRCVRLTLAPFGRQSHEPEPPFPSSRHFRLRPCGGGGQLHGSGGTYGRVEIRNRKERGTPGRALHVERLVRPFGIELANEGIEAILLLQAIAAWRAGCFLFDGEVHALVAAVLLGMTGLDAFDGNAEPEPPDREL